MSNFSRVAALAAFCVVALTTASAPSFALGTNGEIPIVPKLNASADPEVPAIVENSKLAVPEAEPLPLVETEAAPAVEASITPPVRFATLAQAVASQAMPGSIDRDLHCLAGTIYFESKGEPLAGQLAVAQVILNRVRSGRFGKTLCSVVTQRGQFSFVRGGTMPSVGLERAAYRTAVAVAKVAIDDLWESPVPNALFFHARRVSPGWRLKRVASVGNHVFYR